MRIKFKKIISILLVISLLEFQGAQVVLAQTAPSAPSAPTAPPPPSDPPLLAPEAPTAPTAPIPPSAPTDSVPPDSTSGDSSETATPSPKPEKPKKTQAEPTSSGSTTSTSTSPSAGGQTQDGQIGTTQVATGDATTAAVVATDANSNLSTSSPTGSESNGSVKIANNGNGSDSTNSGSAKISDSNTSLQNNSASIVSNLNQDTTTGDNSASRNVGDSGIATGDANTTGTVITAVNTNVDAVSVFEFNVVDDQIGDLVLDFSAANCISGCGPGDLQAKNVGNGAGSTNDALLDSSVNNLSFQNNDALVENNLTLAANSGDNKADRNTGGDSTVVTGDANVSANSLVFANNNIEGKVVYAVVNIFGDLIGDIILPDGSVLSCCFSNAEVVNSGNGSDSTNTGSINQTANNNLYQFNTLDIQNNLVFDANTGDNDVSRNTDGTSRVTTGDSNSIAQVLNVSNLNLVGGNWWLVLVNQAGQWLGKIIGADGSNVAGSLDLQFLVDESGEISVVNSGNGAGSTNTGSVSQTTDNTTVQLNNAEIVNNVNLSANSGGNSASRNTGGNSAITTGDANIVANLVNFVNNNIIGSGKLFVTVVNVFGNWLGNFVGPGYQKESLAAVPASNPENGNQDPALGGASSPSSNSQQIGQNETSAGNQTTSQGVNPTAVNSGQSQVFLGLLGGGIATQIAGFREEFDSSIGFPKDSAALAKKTVNINLAYLIPPLLAVFGFVVIRRRNAFLRLLRLFKK